MTRATRLTGIYTTIHLNVFIRTNYATVMAMNYALKHTHLKLENASSIQSRDGGGF